jgi:hypothetical protein
MNMNKNYLFGIGMVLAMLLAFTAPAAAGNTSYFVPQHSNATIGNSTYVTLYLDIDTDVRFAGGHVQLNFDPAHADIIYCKSASPAVPTGANQYSFSALDKNYDYTDDGYMWGGVSGILVSVEQYGEWVWEDAPGGYITGPATVPICKYLVEAVGTPGESPFDFGFEVYPSGCSICLPCKFSDNLGVPFDVTWVNGTFTHLGGPPETFTKSLPIGWNLISLPLTPLDSSTGAVLGNDTIAYNAVKQYDATTKTFADATTMAPGTGYFVHVTTAGDWVYEGTPETSTSPGLKAGLNMIGVPNCTMSVSGAMGTADYRYVARWNADDQKFEVYNPNAPSAFYGFTEMTAGEGYFVSAKSDDVGWTVSCP